MIAAGAANPAASLSIAFRYAQTSIDWRGIVLLYPHRDPKRRVGF